MYRQFIVSLLVPWLCIVTCGCKDSITCGPGTHLEKQQCLPDVASAAPSASAISSANADISASAATSASAVPLTRAQNAVLQMQAIIAATKDQFRSVRGASRGVYDKHEKFDSNLQLEDCLNAGIWKRPDGTWDFYCEIVPSKTGQKEWQAVELLQQRIDEFLPAIPTDWKIMRDRYAKGYADQFRAEDPTGQFVLRASLTPRVDNSFDASFQAVWNPPKDKPVDSAKPAVPAKRVPETSSDNPTHL